MQAQIFLRPAPIAVFFILLSLLLAACTSSSGTVQQALATHAPVLASTPTTSAPAPVTLPHPTMTIPTAASPTNSAARLPLARPPTLLLADLKQQSEQQRVRPIDPLSLADLPGYAPLDFGRHVATISPDGRVMAVILWPSSWSSGATLHLIDLASWTDTTANVIAIDEVNTLIFGPDGKVLYWVNPTQHDSAHNMPRTFELYRYDLASQTLTTVTTLPPSFIPSELRLLRSGSSLAIYGLPTDGENRAEEPPHVLVVDLVAAHILTDIRLDGIKAGQMLTPAASGEEPHYQLYAPGTAWDLALNLLYIVHADTDTITVVDLATGRIVKQLDIHPQLSLTDRVWQTLIPTAEAKGLPETGRRALLSRDGTRLYIVGYRSEVTNLPTGEIDWQNRPLGLQVVTTGDGSELRHFGLPIGDIALSPDGQWLLLIGEGNVQNQSNGLYLLDTQRLEEPTHLKQAGSYSLYGFSPDGQYAYISSSFGDAGSYWTNWTVTLQVLDLKAHDVVIKRESKGYGEVIPLST
jgi:hypothetical protein